MELQSSSINEEKKENKGSTWDSLVLHNIELLTKPYFDEYRLPFDNQELCVSDLFRGITLLYYVAHTKDRTQDYKYIKVELSSESRVWNIYCKFKPQNNSILVGQVHLCEPY